MPRSAGPPDVSYNTAIVPLLAKERGHQIRCRGHSAYASGIESTVEASHICVKYMRVFRIGSDDLPDSCSPVARANQRDLK